MSIAENLTRVRARIAAAAAAAGRPAASVGLVAVSKAFGPGPIREAAAAGQRDFGENYVQEALPKIEALAALMHERLVWHFIGPLQSNKTAQVAAHFDWVHGIEREKIARRLADQRPAQAPPLNVCVQVNISGEATKSGVAPGDAAALCRAIAALPRLRLRGLMAIPAPVNRDAPLYEISKGARPIYQRLRELYESLRREGLGLDTLSAGMSDDLEAAIAEGSTLVRVGTAIFGARRTRP